MKFSIKKLLLLGILPMMLVIAGCSKSSTDGGTLGQQPGADIDGDGILNENDADVDGDGIPNSVDRDDDNDGIADTTDPVPQPDPAAGTCKYLNIIPPDDDQRAGSIVVVKWDLFGANGQIRCVAPDSGRTDRALAYNTAGLVPNPATSNRVRVGARSAALRLPEWCNSSQKITYNLEGLAALLGQSDESRGAYKALVDHPGGKCADGGETSCPDGQVIVDGVCVTPGGGGGGGGGGGNSCPVGQIVVDGQCVTPGGEGTEIDCPAGQVELNGQCVTPGGSGSTCPEGQIEINGGCEIPSEGTDPNCPEGQVAVDGLCVTPGGDTGIDCDAGEVEVNGKCEVVGGSPSYCPEGQLEIDGVCEIPSEGKDPNCPLGEVPIDGYCKVPDTNIDQPMPGVGCPGDLQEQPDGSCLCSGGLIPDDDNPSSCVSPPPPPLECPGDQEEIGGVCTDGGGDSAPQCSDYSTDDYTVSNAGNGNGKDKVYPNCKCSDGLTWSGKDGVQGGQGQGQGQGNTQSQPPNICY